MILLLSNYYNIYTHAKILHEKYENTFLRLLNFKYFLFFLHNSTTFKNSVPSHDSNVREEMLNFFVFVLYYNENKFLIAIYDINIIIILTKLMSKTYLCSRDIQEFVTYTFPLFYFLANLPCTFDPYKTNYISRVSESHPARVRPLLISIKLVTWSIQC